MLHIGVSSYQKQNKFKEKLYNSFNEKGISAQSSKYIKIK
jgi:hypothetical protein